MSEEIKKPVIDPMTDYNEADKAKDEVNGQKLLSMLRFGTPDLYEKMISAVEGYNLSALREIEEHAKLFDAIRDVIHERKTYTTIADDKYYAKLMVITALMNKDIKPEDLYDIEAAE